MVLEYGTIQIPFGAGLAQGIDPRVVPVGRLLDAQNAWIDKAGAVRKRHGFVLTTNAMVDAAAPAKDYARTLFSTGDELCLLGWRRLYAYDDTAAGWQDRGSISPFAATQTDIFREAVSHDASDCDECNGYVMSASSRRRQADDDILAAGYEERAVTVRVDNIATGIVTVPPLHIGVSSSGATWRHAPRMAHADDVMLVGMIRGANPLGVANALDVYHWSSSNPSVLPAFLVTPTIDLYSQATDCRTYDMTAMATEWAVAYIDETTRVVTVRQYDTVGALIATRVLNTNAPYTRVTLHYDARLATLYVMAVSHAAGAGTMSIECWDLDNDGALTVLWGPSVVYGPAVVTVYNLGCAEDTGVLTCCWSEWAGNRDTMHTLGVNSATGAVVDADLPSYNLVPVSKPFWITNRCYVACQSATGEELFEHAAIYDITTDDWPRTMTVVGLSSIGTAPVRGNVGLSFGSCNNAVKIDTRTIRYMTSLLTQYLSGQTRRYAQVAATLDFSAAPEAAVVHGGGAVIGGGMVTWYAGARTEELGWPTAPILGAAPATSIIGGGIPAGTYQWQWCYESQDERGYWHRSMPSPAVEVVIAAPPNDSEDFVFLTLPASLRWGAGSTGHDSAIIAYRAGADAVFRRVTPPIRVVPNIRTATLTAHWIDIGYAQGAPLYTDAGLELENAAPEGALLVRAIGDRVDLAGFWTRSRWQYSKGVVPATAAESLVAPEFHEAFGKALPIGKSITGLASLDGARVLLTREGVYLISGYGPAADGSSDDFSPPTLVSTVGCIEHRSVVEMPGGVMYQAAHGIVLLGHGHDVTSIGEDVRDVLAVNPVVTSAVHVADAEQVRFTVTNVAETTGQIIVYDYGHQVWTFWTPTKAAGPIVAVAACMHNGTYYIAERDSTVWREDATSYLDTWAGGSAYVTLQLTTAWLAAPAGAGTWKRVRQVMPLCEYRDAHRLTIGIGHDYEATFGQSSVWDNAQLVTFAAAPREQPKVRLQRQKCQAVRVRIADTADAVTPPTTGEGYSIAGLVVEMGVCKGLAKVGEAQRR